MYNILSMTHDQSICFRANSEKIEQINKIAERHSRTRSSLLQALVDSLLKLDDAGKLEDFLLKQAKEKSAS